MVFKFLIAMYFIVIFYVHTTKTDKYPLTIKFIFSYNSSSLKVSLIF